MKTQTPAAQPAVADMFLRGQIRKIARPLADAGYFHDDEVILGQYDVIRAFLMDASGAPEAEIRAALSYADAQLEVLAPAVYPRYIQPAVVKLGLVDVPAEFRAAVRKAAGLEV
jgi:hypothetical protein